MGWLVALVYLFCAVGSSLTFFPAFLAYLRKTTWKYLVRCANCACIAHRFRCCAQIPRLTRDLAETYPIASLTWDLLMLAAALGIFVAIDNTTRRVFAIPVIDSLPLILAFSRARSQQMIRAYRDVLRKTLRRHGPQAGVDPTRALTDGAYVTTYEPAEPSGGTASINQVRLALWFALACSFCGWFAQDSSNVTVTTSVHVILVENSLCWSRRGEAGSELPLKDITDVFVGKQLNIWHQPATLQVQ